MLPRDPHDNCTPLDIALEYTRRDPPYSVTPVGFGTKKPTLKNWADARLATEDLPRHFNGHHANIGGLNGAPSGNRVDVDVDGAQAIQLAGDFLPPTNSVFGRASKPRSHYIYISNPPPKTQKLLGPQRQVIAEVRSTGSQTVLPGSVHPSGEQIEWDQDDSPATVHPDDLCAAVGRLAAAAVAVESWTDGVRHDAALALAGGTLRDGRTVEEVAHFIEAVARVAGDIAQIEQHRQAVLDTAAKLKSCEEVTGWPRLRELFGDKPVKLIRKYLGKPGGVAVGGSHPARRGPSQASLLVASAETVELFHDSEGTPFATVPVKEHRETWPIIKSPGFRGWLIRQFYESRGTVPGAQAQQDALGLLAAKARYDGPEQVVFTRIGHRDGRLYIDRGSDDWDAIEVGDRGWRIVADPPLKFRRARGILQLPTPIPGGSIDELRPFLNVASDVDFRLVASWLVAALQPWGPYPVLVLGGEQGAAKSTTTRVLRELVDPNTATLRSEPREVRDLLIAATNAWMMSYDNLSHMPPWLSDALCRLATGGGYATRELYSDADEIIFNVKRPIILNGIEELAVRSDLLDRTLLLDLPSIPPTKRRSEVEFWAKFEAARPRILGALLDALSRSLRDAPRVKLGSLPRMADFAIRSVAAAPALGWTGRRFLNAYGANRAIGHDRAREASPLANPIRMIALAHATKGWQGTATTLLETLNRQQLDYIRPRRGWPDSPRALTNALRRLRPNLLADGTEVTFARVGKSGTRVIRITRRASSRASAPSTSSANRRRKAEHMGAVTSDPAPIASTPSVSHGAARHTR